MFYSVSSSLWDHVIRLTPSHHQSGVWICYNVTFNELFDTVNKDIKHWNTCRYASVSFLYNWSSLRPIAVNIYTVNHIMSYKCPADTGTCVDVIENMPLRSWCIYGKRVACRAVVTYQMCFGAHVWTYTQWCVWRKHDPHRFTGELLKVFTINPDQIQRQNVFCYFWHQVWAGNLMNLRTWGAHEGVVCSCSIVLWVNTPARTCDRSHLKIQNSQKWRASSVKDLWTFRSSPYTVTFSLLSSCYRY